MVSVQVVRCDAGVIVKQTLKVCCNMPKSLTEKFVERYQQVVILCSLKNPNGGSTAPWTDTARAKYKCQTDRYPSDLTDKEWAILQPMVPLARHGGRPRTTDMREVINAIFYIGTTGCQWRALPSDFPPMTTVQGYFYDWRDAGVLDAMNDLLVMSDRDLQGRASEPTAGVIDSQSVKTTESGGIRGYDAGKKINGRKRHIVTDTIGLLLMIVVHAASYFCRWGLCW